MKFVKQGVLSFVVGSISMSSYSAFSADRVGLFLQSEVLPAQVSETVTEITKIGREESDFFGIQQFEAFSIVKSSAMPSLKKIVADVIEASRRHGEYSLADFCVNGYNANLELIQLANDLECARYLISYERSPRLELILSTLENEFDGGPLNVRLRSSVATLRKYLDEKVSGDQIEEISVSMTGLNVSEENIVLINKSKGYVVIFKFDFGA